MRFDLLFCVFLRRDHGVDLNGAEFRSFGVDALHAVVAHLIGVEVAHFTLAAIGAFLAFVQYTFFTVHGNNPPIINQMLYVLYSKIEFFTRGNEKRLFAEESEQTFFQYINGQKA